MKSKGKPYTGKLLQPIRLPDHWAGRRRLYGERVLQFLGPAAERHDARVRSLSEDERLPQLFEHFGISPASEDAWQNLALALARKHVPGFSAVRERGAPVTRDAFVKYRLYKWSRRKKNALAGRGNVTQRQVCEALSRDRQFKTDMPELAKLSPKGLANTLSKALKMRRANVLHRWGVRATLRKIANLPQDEIAELSVGLFGDTPYWPGRVHRELKKPSR